MQQECATFRLSTFDIDPTATGTIETQYGRVDPIKSDTTWYNVNFRSILGDMMDKYTKFNIKLVSMHFTSVAFTTTDLVELLCKINICGLPFSNCNYDFKKNLVNYSVIGLHTITDSTQQYFLEDNSITIHKPSEKSDIRIFLTTFDGLPPDWTTFIAPQYEFNFKIYGIKD